MKAIMNKKHRAYSLAILFLTMNQSSSMHVKLAQRMAVPAAISTLTYAVGKMKAVREKHGNADLPDDVQQWTRKCLAKKGIKNADSIQLKMVGGSEFAVVNGSSIAIGVINCVNVQFALLGKSITETNPFSKETSSVENSSFVKELSKVEMILAHEAHHYKNGDFGKSCLLLGAMLPLLYVKFSTTPLQYLCKFALFMGANAGHARYCEIQADKFACENAETRLQLEEFHNFFQENNGMTRWEHCKLDHGVHPYPADRANMVQKYIDEWDKNHKNE